jgi:hypothetical protein
VRLGSSDASPDAAAQAQRIGTLLALATSSMPIEPAALSGDRSDRPQTGLAVALDGHRRRRGVGVVEDRRRRSSVLPDQRLGPGRRLDAGAVARIARIVASDGRR